MRKIRYSLSYFLIVMETQIVFSLKGNPRFWEWEVFQHLCHVSCCDMNVPAVTSDKLSLWVHD